MTGRKAIVWAVAISMVAALGTAILINVHKRRRITLKGAITRFDADPNKQLPVGDVEITATTGFAVTHGKSDPSGFFSLTLPKGFRRQQSVSLQFQHAGYLPLEVDDFISDKLYVTRLTPFPAPQRLEGGHAESGNEVTVSNVRVRYSVKATTEAEVGNAVKTFQVGNAGNIPCGRRPPCSPDGKWKATVNSESLDAGQGNVFRNVRVSCIAGPCPFTGIEAQQLSQGGQILKITARNWSDTATFLLEAEVVHPMVSDNVRESFPVIFGPALNFSLPAAAEGLTLEADINSDAIVFPLGPDLFLNWAQCSAETNRDQTTFYRCELKTGYRFR